MIFSTDILRRNVMGILTQVEAQIDEVKKVAEDLNIRPEQLRDSDGNWVISPLLFAKMQGYATLAALNESDKSRRDKK